MGYNMGEGQYRAETTLVGLIDHLLPLVPIDLTGTLTTMQMCQRNAFPLLFIAEGDFKMQGERKYTQPATGRYSHH